VIKKGAAYEYQYAIADHQGNTRVVFSSAPATPVAVKATFEGDATDQSTAFANVSNVVTMVAANQTAGGSKVVRMNQGYSVGPSKSMKVFTGDKIDVEVYAYYEQSSGWGTTNAPLTTLVTAIAGAFGGVSGAVGESGSIFSGVNTALGGFGLGANAGDGAPSAFLNYILFDKNYKVMNMGWKVVPTTARFAKQRVTLPTINVKEAGYLFTYLSYEDQSNNYVYFDDYKVTYTPTNIVQYNEYYPYGLVTNNSWTKENAVGNNFLGNGGTELNTTTSLYDLEYRNYDPALARMHQVDPMADKYASYTPYNYSFNAPSNFNDVNGADPSPGEKDHVTRRGNQILRPGITGGNDFSRLFGGHITPGSGGNWADQYSGLLDIMSLAPYTGTWTPGGGWAPLSNESALQAAIIYNNQHGSWGNTLLNNASNGGDGVYTYMFESRNGSSYGGFYFTEGGQVSSILTSRLTQGIGGWISPGGDGFGSFNWVSFKTRAASAQTSNDPSLLFNPTGNGIRNDNGGSGYFGAPRDGRKHKGVDFSSIYGQDVYAPTDGRIYYTSFKNDYGTQTPMAYLLPKNTKLGFQQIDLLYVLKTGVSGRDVKIGDVIGTSGSLQTLGYPSNVGPHVHLQMLSGGVKIDPTKYFFK
jgi:RHS repeat-associated protein